MTIFGTVTTAGKKEIKNGWEFELNIKLNFFIISTLETQSDGNCTHFFLLPRSPTHAMGLMESIFIHSDASVALGERLFPPEFPSLSSRDFPARLHHCTM